ncbi:MAG: hypothetical protein OEX18_02510 [Candidatus Krumholzibacteria bacterium]|nr:hypothetical protein [Candidatus Krumholzibacteria bacterium]MDH4336131.1 hypothetical protein [Candidatus Krumholzibacteria bacterium]MDH5268772.1 hypothetical protein [Candidatus Krumholzibacteria bacterium]MDH5627365.1 hypothetical protein [Candidatus Krumholzibacteria bacterium]
MELKPSQYQAAMRLLKSADEAILHVMSGCKRKDEASRLRRGIEEAESLLKKVKQELRVG